MYIPEAKNNLGILYKNGEFGVEKNIYLAIEYFKEAIKIPNHNLPIYNLAKIYYFGIDIVRNVSEAISLLLKGSNQGFVMADVFLFLIYSCDEEFKNKDKAVKYHYKINKKMKNHFIYSIYDNNISDGLYFIEQIDCIYDPNDYIQHDLLNFFFGFETPKRKKVVKYSNEIIPKHNINNQFYEGFGL